MSKFIENKKINFKELAYTLWAIVGAGIIAIAILNICGILWQAVSALILTAFIVFLLAGFVGKLQEKGIPRPAGVGIAFLAIFALLVGVIALLMPNLTLQIAAFATMLPSYANQLQSFLENNTNPQVTAIINEVTRFLNEQSGQILSGMADGLMGTATNVGNAMLVVMISLICSAWVLIDYERIRVEIYEVMPDNIADKITIMTTSLSVAFSGWLKSTIICAVITGFASGLIFAGLQIPYAVMLGVLCAFLYLIPYIGPFIAMLIVAMLAMFVSPITCILSICANGVIGFVVGNIISPRLMQSSVSVHPAITLIAILIGGALGGPLGMLLSIPIVAALQSILVILYERRTGKKLGTKDGALFRTKDEKLEHVEAK